MACGRIFAFLMSVFDVLDQNDKGKLCPEAFAFAYTHYRKTYICSLMFTIKSNFSRPIIIHLMEALKEKLGKNGLK